MGRAMDLHTDVLSLVTIHFLIIPDSVNGQQEQGVNKVSIGGFVALGCVAGFVLLVLALSAICYLVRRSRHAKYVKLRQIKLETKILVSAKNDSFLNDHLVQPSITGLSDAARPARKDKSHPVEVTQEFEIIKPFDNEAQVLSAQHAFPLLEDRRHSAYHRSDVESEPYIYPLDEGSDQHAKVSCSKSFKNKFNRHIQIPDTVHYSYTQRDDYKHHSDTSQFSYSQKDVINEKHYPFGIETTGRSYEPANSDPLDQYSFRRLSDSIDCIDSISERYKSPSPTVANMLYAKNPKLRNQPGQSSRRDIRETRSAGSFGSSVYSVGGAPQSYYMYTPSNYYLPWRPSVVLARPQTEMSIHQEQPHPHQRVFVRSPVLTTSANRERLYVTNWRDSWPIGSVHYANTKLSSYRPKVLQTIAPVAVYAPTPLVVVEQPPQNITTRPAAVIMPLGGSQFRMVNESQASPQDKVISSVRPPTKKGGKPSRNKLKNREVRHVSVNDQGMQLQSNNPNATYIWREVPEKGRNNADSRYSSGREYNTETVSLEFGDEHAETGYMISNNRRTGTKPSEALKLHLRRNSKIDDEVVIIDYVSKTGAEPPPVTVASDDRLSGLYSTVSQQNSDNKLDSEFDGGRRRQRAPHYGSFEMLPRERYLK